MNIHKSLQILALFPISLSTFLGDIKHENILAEYEMSLENRQPDRFVNEVFKDNILLNLAYMQGKNIDPKKVNWDSVRSPFTYEFELKPGQVFAYHDDVLAKYQPFLVKHTNAHFNAADGFKTDGYLFGDGVCHLASLINIVAQKANLEVEAPTRHDFMPIPDIPKEYGVSIYNNPYAKGSNAQQNLYITNNKSKPISFRFEYQDNKVKVAVLEN